MGKSVHIGRKGVFLNGNEITRAFVLDPNAAVNTGAPVGFVRIHDYLRLGLA